MNSSNKNPKVSVIIPTFKRSTYLKRAIDSVLSQTYSNIEIIVVDDNDPETEYRKETKELMLSFSDYTNIIYLEHEHNKNGSAARNTGIRASSGEYITFLDDDDEFLSNKIELQVKKMEQLDESWGGCYTGYKKIGESGSIQESKEKREGNILVIALMRNLFVGSGSNLLFRRKAVEAIGEFDESFIRNQDFEFLVRICHKYKIAYVDSCELLIHYEIRENKRSFDEIVRIDNHFLNTFKPLIDSQSDKDKKRIYDMVALIRLNTSIRKRCVWKGIKGLLDYKVSLYSIIKYLMHLCMRLITKSSYGFKL
ncbi:glycosyltransferase family 2 protein [Marinilactibacillus psychrotolerans]|uniref:glycosyltransferase family 2 protein n=1 Tax=Marinilactibacillus psychrotolerans TaxID=191770 RepID=UPI003887B7D0